MALRRSENACFESRLAPIARIAHGVVAELFVRNGQGLQRAIGIADRAEGDARFVTSRKKGTSGMQFDQQPDETDRFLNDTYDLPLRGSLRLRDRNFDPETGRCQHTRATLDVIAEIDKTSRRMSDLAQQLGCLGYFDETDGPRAA